MCLDFDFEFEFDCSEREREGKGRAKTHASQRVYEIVLIKCKRSMHA